MVLDYPQGGLLLVNDGQVKHIFAFKNQKNYAKFLKFPKVIFFGGHQQFYAVRWCSAMHTKVK